MYLNWKNIKNNIINIFKSKSDKKYLIKLVENLDSFQKENKNISFTITDVKEKGFIVKVGGLFAYASFYHMPWKYNSTEFWKAISKHLIGKKFYCSIYKIKREPLSILINAESHQFKKIELTEDTEYGGIVINKAKYGIFVDIGHHFNWQYGSFVGLIHKSNIDNYEESGQITTGDEIKIVFNGYTEKGKLILSENKYHQKEWLTGKLNELIGTIQEVKTIITEENKKEYYIKDKYKTSIPITKTIYPKYKTKAKSLIQNLTHNSVIKCEIIEINKQKRKFVSKLIFDTIKKPDNN